MGIFNAVSQWKDGKFEEHRSYMKSIGRCPDCGGRGFIPTVRAVYTAPPSCPECNGSGRYSDI